MKRITRFSKPIAIFFLAVMLIELLAPLDSYALTSGPSQPESQEFQQAGVSDMVNTFTGDFSYNIPLCDVGGYPINLSYQAGEGMDDEASWVGAGWTLNPGAVTRQLRGLPDDFNGKDQFVKEITMKPETEVGVKLRVKGEIFATDILNLSAGLSVGVFNNSYKGMGAEFGVNAGISIGSNGSGELTGGLAVDLNSNTQKGVTITPSVNFGVQLKANNNMDLNAGLSVGLPYNTRAGLRSMTLGSSFSATVRGHWTKEAVKPKDIKKQTHDIYSGQSSISFVGENYNPTINIPFKSSGFTGNLDLGPAFFGGYVGGGATGYYTRQEVAEKRIVSPAYGFLYAENGRKDPKALMDFSREKDNPYEKTLPYLPIPIMSNDYFVASNQGNSSQYKVTRSGTGVVFDNRSEMSDKNNSYGLEVGLGNIFQAGADIHKQVTTTTTQKWAKGNSFANVGDFSEYNSQQPELPPAYFKRVGEMAPANNSMFTNIGGYGPVGVNLQGNLAKPAVYGTQAVMHDQYNSNYSISSKIARTTPDKRNNTLTYLTASEASKFALDKKIKSYSGRYTVTCPPTGGEDRVNEYRQPHHLSEITVTGDAGERNVYGIPVYNRLQEEVSFSVEGNSSNSESGVIGFTAQDNSLSNKKGRENYYTKEVTPPYATSFLLTAILSPDYVDRTGDGISDDDLGTAVKFNYTKMSGLYEWRTPYSQANFNEGQLSDPKDDKASYMYGKKELWYLHSIESKTMIAEFELAQRNDAIGATAAGTASSGPKQQYLKTIKIFSKSDLISGSTTGVVPIKTVHFAYDYTISNGLPNNQTGAGKLTLKKVWFTFYDNDRGKLHPYEFEYNTDGVYAPYNTYARRQTDRWGTFKDKAANPYWVSNSDFPYALQDSAKAALFASLWQMRKITLPSGGVINVTYESDDYAYVQDKRAMNMYPVIGVGNTAGDLNSGSGLVLKDWLLVKIPSDPTTDVNKLRYKYLNGMDKVYFKCLVDLDRKSHHEFVSGYADLKGFSKVNDTTLAIQLGTIEGKRAIAKTAWQYLRISLPQYAYGYEVDPSQWQPVQAITALIKALVQLVTELQGDFDDRAALRMLSNNLTVKRSWVRLTNANLKKYGGGHRVKKITISDEWSNMSGETGSISASYGQEYVYSDEIRTTTNEYKQVSTGVASYEPLLGNDENPFREPIMYKSKVPLALTNYYYMEMPLCESYFPAPAVGYAKVITKNLGADGSNYKTGYTISEYYTAKDFPTKVQATPIDKRKTENKKLMRLFSADIEEYVACSQGYSIELNDMHGKMKSVQVYNKGGGLIAADLYEYKVDNPDAPVKTLNNNVSLLNKNETVTTGIIGEDVEMLTDMREQETSNYGKTVQPSVGLFLLGPFPIPYGFVINKTNSDFRKFNSASTIKIVQRFGIIQKVTRMANGSSMSTENILWDAETGHVLLAKTQNEFDDPVYNFTYPAHWAYDGMAQAYKNVGTVIKNFSCSSGSISTFPDLFVAGDEIIYPAGNVKGWVIEPSAGVKRLVDKDGNFLSISGEIKITRSGRRNIAAAPIGDLTTLKNPIKNGSFDVSVFTEILDADALEYSDLWAAPVDKVQVTETTFECMRPECVRVFMLSALSQNYPYSTSGCTKTHRSFYAPEARKNTAAIYADDIITSQYGNTECNSIFYDGDPAEDFQYYVYGQALQKITWPIHPSGQCYYFITRGDSAKLGNLQINFDYVDWLHFNLLGNLSYNTVTPDTLTRVDGLNVRVYSKDTVGQPGECFYELSANKAYLDEIMDGPDSATLAGLGKPLYPRRSDSVLLQFRIKVPIEEVVNPCATPVGRVINPYYTGIKGNWRPIRQHVYDTERTPVNSTRTIRKAGTYTDFEVFWDLSGTTYVPNSNNESKWVRGLEKTFYSKKGMDLENKDALDHYSAAQMGYLETIPVALATNARHRQIGFDGFEDYNFLVGCSSSTNCSDGHFSFKDAISAGKATLQAGISHSGNYSLKLTGNAEIFKEVGADSTNESVLYVSGNKYYLNHNELFKGFAPITGEQYILSFWVKDNTANKNIPVEVYVGDELAYAKLNITAAHVSTKIEGWKRVEIAFPFMNYNPVSKEFRLRFKPTGTVYIDDVRIFPKNAGFKSFVYDERSQRLLAELDGNNFATFYEYDDEGALVRVKRETERGIMTIKEIRSANRKRYN